MGLMGVSEISVNRKVWMRKHRFLFQALGGPGGFVHTRSNGSFVHMASRPKVTFEQRKINHAVETVPYHGRPTWENTELTFMDAGGDARLWIWMQRHYNPKNGKFGYRSDVTINCQITMVNGCNDLCEKWMFYDAFIAMMDWGQLEYASTDISQTTVSLAYTRAVLVEHHKPEDSLSSEG